MKEFYTIGETGKIFNMTTDTLRFYDRIGLLRPWTVGDNGYRYYSKAQFEIISTIKLLRSMGTPIERITEIIHSDDTSGISRELERYTGEIDHKIAELQTMKQKTSLLGSLIAETDSGSVISPVTVPAMWFMSKPFGDTDELDIEEILKTGRAAEQWVSTASIVSTVTVDDLYRGNYHTYDRYGYLSELPCPIDSPYLTRIEEQTCICGSAVVDTVEHFEVDQVYDAIMGYIADNGCTVTGDAIERNVIDLYPGSGPAPRMYFRIYVPVLPL